MRDDASLYYLDASALLKLVVEEPESPALMADAAAWPHLVSSSLVRVEVPRAARRVSADVAVVARARHVVGSVGLLPLDESVLRRAAEAAPPSLRSLDAIHLASALSLGEDLAAMVVYDRRLADAAEAAGLTVLVPA